MMAECPAAVHVDGTARPQLIQRDVNPGYYDVIAEYRKITGVSTMINTSFNMHEEPIVCTPADAVRAFLDGRLDALSIGPYLVRRPGDAPLQAGH
jgi:carbamoyltransferase